MRYAGGLLCRAAWDPQCTWAVLGPLNIADDDACSNHDCSNPCSYEVWDRCIGDQTYTDEHGQMKQQELCASGITRCATAASPALPRSCISQGNFLRGLMA
jgi:hypothetical protein